MHICCANMAQHIRNNSNNLGNPMHLPKISEPLSLTFFLKRGSVSRVHEKYGEFWVGMIKVLQAVRNRKWGLVLQLPPLPSISNFHMYQCQLQTFRVSFDVVQSWTFHLSISPFFFAACKQTLYNSITV